MASESASASTATGVGSTTAPTIREIISTNRNPQIWKDFNLCIMTDNSQKAQCKHCFHFLSQGSNTTLRNHITHPHCEAIKAQQNQNPTSGQTSMARDGSVFMYDLDYLREQFAGTDKTKITRNPSKTGKHGHEERKSTKEARDAKPKAGKVKKSKLWSTLGQFSCMRTRSQARSQNRRQQQLTTVIVEEPEFPMADNRTMAQMLQAPIEGYEDAIVVPPINANNFELKQTLINLVQSNQFTGKQDPHNHLRFFNKVTSTFRHPEVPNTTIKLLLFPFSLEGEARTWLDKEPPRSILTWDDLVSKFINQFFPPSKTTYLRNEITTFYQKPNETFNEAWERFKGLLRQCPHHGFSELHQLDTFYNSLNTNDQDALDSAAGGNFLDKMPRDGLAIIESKSKVRYSRSRAIEPRVSTNAPLSTSTPSNSFEFQQLAASLEDKMDIRMSRLEKMISEKNVTTPATVKAVEEVCVTCGSNHNFNNCPLTRNEFPVFHDNIHQFQQTAAVGNFVQRNPPNLANQMRPPGFNQPNVQNNQGNQSRYQGNNFNSNQNRGGNFNQNRQNNQGAVYQPINHRFTKFHHIKLLRPKFKLSTTIPSDAPFPSSSPMKTSDSTFEEFINEFTLPNSLPPGDDVSIHKKDIHEEIFSNPLFEFDDNFKSSNVNPLFEENDKDVEIKSSSSFTLTSPEEK
ncbi:reverse transcriptase domain-containing protein [Tanacetum coccineum]